VSVNCPECFDQLDDLQAQLKQILADLRKKRKIKASHWLATLSVNKVSNLRTDAGVPLSVRHDPEDGDESHCGIYGLVDVELSQRNVLQLAIAACLVEPPTLVGELDKP
jgi:hypothetical protein